MYQKVLLPILHERNTVFVLKVDMVIDDAPHDIEESIIFQCNVLVVIEDSAEI